MSQLRMSVWAVAAMLASTSVLFAQSGPAAPQQPYYVPPPPATDAQYKSAMAPSEGAACQGSLWDHLRPWFQWTHWGYPEEFKAVPYGVRTQTLLTTQVCNGMALQLALFRYDFAEETAAQPDVLNPAGRRRLAYVLALVEKYQAHPIAIEATGNPALDAARRQHVLAAITAERLTMPSDWVITADPASISLRGADAKAIYDNLLKNTKARGITVGSGTDADSSAPTMPTMPQLPGGGQ